MTEKESREHELLEEIERLKDRLAQHVQSEEANRETEERYRSVVEHAPFPIVVIDRDLKVQFVNRLMPGFKPEDVVGRSIFDNISAEDPDEVVRTIEHVFDSGEVGTYRIKGPRFDGGIGIYETTVSPIVVDGEVVAATNVARDITNELEAIEALRDSEERYRALADSSFEGIVIHENGIMREVNQRICEISGYEPDELIGESIKKFLSPESLHLVMEHIARGTDEPYEVEGLAEDGSVLELEVVGKELTYRGKPVRVAAVRDIRARNEAERAIRESQERYRLVTENLHDVVWTMDLDLNYTYISPSVEVQRGYTPEEVLGQSIQDVMTPDSLEKVYQVVNEVLLPIISGDADPHTNVTLELDMLRKDGSVIPTEMSISLLLDDDEVPIGILGVTRDITERKAAEDAIQESQSLYRLLAHNVDDIIFTMGPDLEFRYVSPSLERVTGFNSDELMQMGWQGIMSPDSVERTMISISEDVLGLKDEEKGRTPSSMLEVELKRKQEGTIWAEVNVSLLRDRDKEVTGILGVARDITERKAAEEVVRESEERYRLLAENVADIIFILGTDLTFAYVSPSFEKVTGYSVEELLEMGWQDILYPESLETAMALLEENLFESMQAGTSPYESIILEMGVISKDGGLVWAEVKISLIHDSGGEVMGILGVARDITERKETQERLMEEKKRSELYLDLFGHDIRNINQGIMSYLELMLMRPGLEPDEADYIKSVLVQATRINDLVAKVQRLTQLRTRTVEVEDVDAGHLLQGAIDYVVAKHPDRAVTVQWGERCSGITVRGSNLLLDVFTSILDNSVRFDRNEVVVVDIECEPAEDGRRMRISFADRGPGLPDDMKDKVFKRLDLPEGSVKGSGLGLTVVWEIIKRVDGRVWVEDRVEGEPTKGCRFVVELESGRD